MTHPENTVAVELCQLFLGAPLGQGKFRTVYAHALDRDLVIKVERQAGEFANVIEWDTWREADGEARAWLAPCLAISPCGLVLVQCRVRPILPDDMPARLPDFINDTNISNFGWLNGKVVACDYGSPRRLRHWRMTKVGRA